MTPFTLPHTDEERPDGWSFDMWLPDTDIWNLRQHRATWVATTKSRLGQPGYPRHTMASGNRGWLIQVAKEPGAPLVMADPGWLTTDLLLKRVAARKWLTDRGEARRQLLVFVRTRQEDLRARLLEYEDIVHRISREAVEDCEAGTCTHQNCARERIAAARAARA